MYSFYLFYILYAYVLCKYVQSLLPTITTTNNHTHHNNKALFSCCRVLFFYFLVHLTNGFDLFKFINLCK